ARDARNADRDSPRGRRHHPHLLRARGRTGAGVRRAALEFALAIGLFSLIGAQQAPPLFDVLITNARIVDGSGSPSTTGSVGIRNGRIAAVGRASGPAARTIDAAGRVL